MGRFSLLAMSLAGASVALVILVDLATGQGPPVLNAYMSRLPPPPEFRQPGPPPPVALNYMRPEFERPEPKKEEYKDKEEIKKEQKEFKALKELEKEEFRNPYPGKRFEKEYESEKSTPAPGYMSSLSNTMSGAWKSLTGLGNRSKRSNPSNPKARSFDDLELKHYSNQGYVFFKVPKSLVCDY